VFDPFTFYDVPLDAPTTYEPMGTKDKFWFDRAGESWLFKASRPDQGQHWAEVLAAALASKLGLPHAQYQIARCRTEIGVVTPRFTAEGYELVHGNEFLADRDPSYPRDGERYKTREHTIDAVKAAIVGKGVQLPVDWLVPIGISLALDVFAGYLLLDAWIGNTDRHHENWGIVRSKSADYLAPTFDHASSLGAHLSDEQRFKRLASRDKGFQVETYVKRARSALYSKDDDVRPLKIIQAFAAWSQGIHGVIWLQKLSLIAETDVEGLISQFPHDAASASALTFALEMLKHNKKHIMETV